MQRSLYILLFYVNIQQRGKKTLKYLPNKYLSTFLGHTEYDVIVQKNQIMKTKVKPNEVKSSNLILGKMKVEKIGKNVLKY